MINSSIEVHTFVFSFLLSLLTPFPILEKEPALESNADLVVAMVATVGAAFHFLKAIRDSCNRAINFLSSLSSQFFTRAAYWYTKRSTLITLSICLASSMEQYSHDLDSLFLNFYSK